MKIEGVVWFTHRGKCIGIVWGITEPIQEKKAYIGVVDYPTDEKTDAEYIAKHGVPFILTDEILENFRG